MWRRWWWLPCAAIAIGAALTALVAREVGRRDQLARRAALDDARPRVGFAVRDRIRLPAEALHTVGAFLAHAPTVERATFDAVAADVLARLPPVYALEWAPMVTADQRAAVEAQAGRDLRPDWRVREPGPDGLVTATVRARYLPILFSYPTNDAWGFDVLSRPESQRTSATACQRGETTASPRYRLIEDAEDRASIIIYQPVWRGGQIPTTARCESMHGLAVLIFRVSDVLAEVVVRAERDRLDVVVDDVTTAGAAERLFESRPGAAARAARVDHVDTPLPLYGRTWRVRLASTAPAASRVPAIAIGAALTAIATGLLVVIAWLFTHRRRLTAMSRLGQYQVERELGRGAMGVVYRARHRLLGRPAALKLLAPDLVDAASRARFEREVRLAAQLQHPGIVTVYDFGVTAEGLFFYAMELLDGITVRDLIQDAAEVPVARSIHIVRQVAAALSEAHRNRIVHRDLAPANLMITVRADTYDVVKVLDFGLVKRIRAVASDDVRDSAESDPGVVIGSPGFIAPEVLRGRDADERVDVYALGAVWYALLTGLTPFSGSTPAAIMRAQLRGAPVSLRKLRPTLPAAIEELIMDCMQPDPRLRVRSMADLLLRLDTLDVPAWTQDDARAWWAARRS